jgi:hypothetical protein
MSTLPRGAKLGALGDGTLSEGNPGTVVATTLRLGPPPGTPEDCGAATLKLLALLVPALVVTVTL